MRNNFVEIKYEVYEGLLWIINNVFYIRNYQILIYINKLSNINLY